MNQLLAADIVDDERRLEWTQKVGGTFLDQHDEVMEIVQKLMAKAEADRD